MPRWCSKAKPLSFLATPGAMDVGVELHSTSKNFNMTGWRCGFVAGNELLVKAYGDVKDNTDSGSSSPSSKRAHTRSITRKSRGNREEVFAPHGPDSWRCSRPPAFRRASRGARSFCTSLRPSRAEAKEGGKPSSFPPARHFSQWMITENLISTVPWDDAGAYVRFSVTFAAKDAADEKAGDGGNRAAAGPVHLPLVNASPDR